MRSLPPSVLPLTLLASLLFATGAGAAECRARAGAPRLDHAIVVVRDLEAAAARFSARGYKLKPGRLHPDNLLNKHIKFRDGTELELMSLAGPPTDGIARDYADLLAAGEGGAYVAFGAASGAELDGVAAAAKRLGLDAHRSGSGPFRFVGFPSRGDLGALFFAAGPRAPDDTEALFAHADGASGLREAWVEGGPGLTRLLTRLGAQECGPVLLPNGRGGTLWALAKGTVVVVPRLDKRALPRLLGVVFEKRKEGGRPAPPFEILPGFWLG